MFKAHARALYLTTMATVLLACGAGAQTRLEVEADPIAYALNGFSLHVAAVLPNGIRANVGTFGIDVPEMYHGNDGWTAVMRGAGVKLDYLGEGPFGFFAGVEGGYMRNRYVRAGSPDVEERDVVGVGVRGGYRLPIGGSGLYLAPWVGVGYDFLGDAVRIGAEEFERGPISIFPTVHIGWRF